MRERYEGENGKRRLLEVLSNQELVCHNENIARRLTELTSIYEIQKGKQLYFQGEPGRNELYFVLNGSLELSSKNKRTVVLEPGEAVGEFPIVDPTLSYTVTVVAREHSVVASVSEEQFLSIAREYPEIWKNMARMLVTRLRKASDLPEMDQQSAHKVLKPGDLTIGQLMSSLTVAQLWTIIVSIIGALATVATLAYKMGGRS